MYELIDKDGRKHGPFDSAIAASRHAEERWQYAQDEDRSGEGWDIQLVEDKNG